MAAAADGQFKNVDMTAYYKSNYLFKPLPKDKTSCANFEPRVL